MSDNDKPDPEFMREVDRAVARNARAIRRLARQHGLIAKKSRGKWYFADANNLSPEATTSSSS